MVTRKLHNVTQYTYISYLMLELINIFIVSINFRNREDDKNSVV
jgi:hypothetical protein